MIRTALFLNFDNIRLRCSPMCNPIRTNDQYDSIKCSLRGQTTPTTPLRNGVAYRLISIPVIGVATKLSSSAVFTISINTLTGVYLPLKMEIYYFRLRIWCAMTRTNIPIPIYSCSCCCVTCIAMSSSKAAVIRMSIERIIIFFVFMLRRLCVI